MSLAGNDDDNIKSIPASEVNSSFRDVNHYHYLLKLKKRKVPREKTVCYNRPACPPSMVQATSKTLAQQEEQLKKIETIGALQETNRMLKIDRDKLEQELQQAQAKVRFKCCIS